MNREADVEVSSLQTRETNRQILSHVPRPVSAKVSLLIYFMNVGPIRIDSLWHTSCVRHASMPGDLKLDYFGPETYAMGIYENNSFPISRSFDDTTDYIQCGT
ncbi:hypothetical protein HBH56_022040 [Parastagonospora nodorum]|uniref:Uncharacterized protein n=1 Tax=Phaeosphaeria nodorum (strain SN15 / ATCC MYA-4574 / FGSC 10173) TaxID=321614 RepID=A0A7U2HXI7_PHANO|nr:hypothetical protein HBH56_022040 [Parastagonospora nodorum]QRC95550.1 hypothetical protein JI435_407490 [Parastagonospora nodorum SN15]KAH3937580.1 hypothetical protein HBH54_012440 [Parastagonospora nodorum]KAH3944088.1 hypothetical protein HBH53_164290 [Parastagonospora nodorum]KAH4044191.1 hypothetical protein HBH49_221280 [Parastagonospora nodorum]